MSLAVPFSAPTPLCPPDDSRPGLDAFITTVILSICFHLILSLIGAYRFAEPPPPYQRAPRDLPVINAELVPPTPQPSEQIGAAQTMAESEQKLPPVDAKLVNAMRADSGKTLLACRDCTLAGANFDKAYLRLASFQGADLRKANLSHADLTGTRLSGANLEGAQVTHSNAAGVDLTGANLKGADLSHTRLDAALVENADFTGAKLVGANLRLIEYVKGVKFRNVDATGAIFRYASLRGVDFRGANLSGADFTRARGLSNEQLAMACGDKETKLPEGLVIPMCRDAGE